MALVLSATLVVVFNFLANVLYKSKILESWGRGIGTMVDECKRVGLPVPEFKTDGNFVTVVFKYNRNGVNLQLVNSNPTSTQQVPNKHPTSIGTGRNIKGWRVFC